MANKHLCSWTDFLHHGSEARPKRQRDPANIGKRSRSLCDCRTTSWCTWQMSSLAFLGDSEIGLKSWWRKMIRLVIAIWRHRTFFRFFDIDSSPGTWGSPPVEYCAAGDTGRERKSMWEVSPVLLDIGCINIPIEGLVCKILRSCLPWTSQIPSFSFPGS